MRANGYGVHLGTNQERHPAAHMRSALGYNALFDVCCYSCDLGVAKPDPAFFAAAARRIAARPDRILFIDDGARNVEGARAAGLAALPVGTGAGARRSARVAGAARRQRRPQRRSQRRPWRIDRVTGASARFASLGVGGQPGGR